MSSRAKNLANKYAAALLPSIVADYSIYFASLPATDDKFTSFIIGRFAGFMIFYSLATRSMEKNRASRFLTFFMLFLGNIFVCWIIEKTDVLLSNKLFYKASLDCLLLLLNFSVFVLFNRERREKHVEK